MRNFVHLIMIGATASGKGTLSRYIMGAFDDFFHISLGNILRLHIELNTPLGQKVSSYVNSGKLVPDKLIIESVFQELRKARDQHWILDGFPRTSNQAKLLHGVHEDGSDDADDEEECTENRDEQGLKKNNVTAVFHLNVPDDVIIKRVSNRWIHLPTGRIYSEGFNEPRVKWKDDITGDALVQRVDDNPVVVAERLKIHRELTGPLIDFYRNQHINILELETENIEKAWPIVEKFLKSKIQG